MAFKKKAFRTRCHEQAAIRKDALLVYQTTSVDQVVRVCGRSRFVDTSAEQNQAYSQQAKLFVRGAEHSAFFIVYRKKLHVEYKCAMRHRAALAIRELGRDDEFNPAAFPDQLHAL